MEHKRIDKKGKQIRSDFFKRMEDRAKSLPLNEGIISLTRDLENPSLRGAAANMLVNQKNSEYVITFLYMYASGADEDLRTEIKNILERIGTIEAKEAAKNL